MYLRICSYVIYIHVYIYICKQRDNYINECTYIHIHICLFVHLHIRLSPCLRRSSSRLVQAANASQEVGPRDPGDSVLSSALQGVVGPLDDAARPT